MKTSKTTTKSNLKEAFALWENKKGDNIYYTGKTSDDNSIRLVAFVVKDKKNEKQPDLQVYEQVEKGKEKPQIASLWLNKSKAGKVYYSGTSNEDEKLVAFINEDTQGGKYPSIRVYYRNEEQFSY